MTLAVVVGVAVVIASGGNDTNQVNGEDIPEAAHIQVNSGFLHGVTPDGRTGTPPPALQQGDLQKAADARGLRRCSSTCTTRATPTSPRRATIPDYGTNPPTSGNHATPQQLADGAYSEMPPAWYFVHSLEHGRIEIQYSPDLSEKDQLALKGVFDESPAGMLLLPEHGHALRGRGDRLDAADGLQDIQGRRRRSTRSATSATPIAASAPSRSRSRPAEIFQGRRAGGDLPANVPRWEMASRSRIHRLGGVFEGLMRIKIRYLVAAAVVAVSAWIAAPALSSRLYIPEAKDFEQALPAVDAAAGPAGRRARPASCEGRQRAGELPLAHRRRPGALRPRRPGRRDAAAGDPRPRLRRRLERLGADRGRQPGVRRRRRRAPAAHPRLARRAGTLHYVNVSGTTSTVGGLLTGARRAINSAFISVSGADRARGRRGPDAARHRHPRRMGSEPRRRRVQAPHPPRHGRGEGGGDPPHRHRQRLQPAGGAGDRARHLPLSPQRQRLERHRLPGAGRPLRDALRGARRRARQAGRRRPGAGLQRADHRRSPRSAPTPSSRSAPRRRPRSSTTWPGGSRAPGCRRSARRRWCPPAAS